MRRQPRTVDRIIARLAGRAHGVVTRGELRAEGIPAGQIDRRVRRGALIPQFRGVYRVGHRAPSVEALYMAAVKACGRGAVLSGLAAAFLWGLIRRPPSLPEVTAPTERSIDGIVTRRARRGRIEHTIHRQIPLTTVPRTLVDIAARLDDEQLGRAVHEAQGKHRTTPRQVEAVLARRPNAPGAARLRAAISGDTHITLSALERRFLQRLIEANLPLPDHTNKRINGHRVDCRWIKQRLTVELDSYRFHNSRHSWQQDRQRERAAYARGDQHRRYTYADVFEDPTRMLAELSELLLIPAT